MNNNDYHEDVFEPKFVTIHTKHELERMFGDIEVLNTVTMSTSRLYKEVLQLSAVVMKPSHVVKVVATVSRLGSFSNVTALDIPEIKDGIEYTPFEKIAALVSGDYDKLLTVYSGVAATPIIYRELSSLLNVVIEVIREQGELTTRTLKNLEKPQTPNPDDPVVRVLDKGILEHLARQLAALIPGETEVRYSINRDFAISEEAVFETLSFSSINHDHGFIISERYDGSISIEVPLRHRGLLTFCGIRATRYIYAPTYGGHAVSKSEVRPDTFSAVPYTLTYRTLVSTLMYYFGTLSYLDVLLPAETQTTEI